MIQTPGAPIGKETEIHETSLSTPLANDDKWKRDAATRSFYEKVPPFPIKHIPEILARWKALDVAGSSKGNETFSIHC